MDVQRRENEKPSMGEKPDHKILHVKTNDLNSDRAPNLIAKSIIDLAITIKNNSQMQVFLASQCVMASLMIKLWK